MKGGGVKPSYRLMWPPSIEDIFSVALVTFLTIFYNLGHVVSPEKLGRRAATGGVSPYVDFFSIYVDCCNVEVEREN